jgi:NAD-dependent deacetylase
MSDLPAELESRLATVASVAAITGAGISSESGIPTYRGKGGLYDDPAEGEATIEALSGRTLAVDPDRTWEAIGKLARRAAAARPNPAHRALAAIERSVERFVLLTQNVDGLHQLAGSRNVIDIHGSIDLAQCTVCRRERRFERAELAAIDRTPSCPSCGAGLRPGAVLFGELLPGDKVRRMEEQLFRDVPDLVIAIGTSALFPYITAPVDHARRHGRLTVEVNPDPTGLSARVDFSLRGRAGAWLPEIARAISRNRA